MDQKRQKKWNAKRIIFTVLGIFLLLIFLTAAGVMIYVNSMLNKINRIEPNLDATLSSDATDKLLYEDPELVTMATNPSETYVKLDDLTFPTEPEETSHVTPTQSPALETPSADTVYGDHLINILLVGQDRRPGESRQRSDSMILASINKSNNTLTLTSFMRDMYVQIPGYKPNKLNAAYAYGGMSLLRQTLELNFDVRVDGVVEVDFSGFENIIDLLGGVEVTLNESEANYLNGLYEVKFLDSGVVVGNNRLSGKQALVYARLREIDTDYARARRQRTVITGLIQAYKNLPLTQMPDILNQVLPLVSTDMTNSRIVWYAMELLPMLSSAQINTLRIPVDGTFQGGMVEVRQGFYGWFQYNIDFEANKEALRNVFCCKD